MKVLLVVEEGDTAVTVLVAVVVLVAAAAAAAAELAMGSSPSTKLFIDRVDDG